jgi:taurine--2-oxoglutarate transaminase
MCIVLSPRRFGRKVGSNQPWQTSENFFRQYGSGFFRVIELAREKKTRKPLVKWNVMGTEAAVSREIKRRLLEGGVRTFVRWVFVFGTLLLCIKEDELREGLRVIDKVLDYADTQTM